MATGLAAPDRGPPGGRREIFLPLTGSTLTPVVVFIPLAFLEGVPGVFFRALAITMTVSLLTSLVLAVTLTPSLAAWIIRVPPTDAGHQMEQGGVVLRAVTRVYESAVRTALRHRFITIALCVLLALAGTDLYARLESELLPPLEERGFVLDYVVSPPGTSLTESNRALSEIENVLKNTPEVEGYSRRTGVALGLELTEPNAGDFLVKLRPDSKRSTAEVIKDLRERLKKVEPQIDMDLHGMVGDLIGDLVSSPKPVEIKIFSNDLDFLKQTAPAVKAQIDEVPHVVDTNDGLDRRRPVAELPRPPGGRPAVRPDRRATSPPRSPRRNSARSASNVLQADRVTDIRVMARPEGREPRRAAEGHPDQARRTAPRSA